MFFLSNTHKQEIKTENSLTANDPAATSAYSRATASFQFLLPFPPATPLREHLTTTIFIIGNHFFFIIYYDFIVVDLLKKYLCDIFIMMLGVEKFVFIFMVKNRDMYTMERYEQF